jgi:hypothetical protein
LRYHRFDTLAEAIQFVEEKLSTGERQGAHRIGGSPVQRGRNLCPLQSGRLPIDSLTLNLRWLVPPHAAIQTSSRYVPRVRPSWQPLRGNATEDLRCPLSNRLP